MAEFDANKLNQRLEHLNREQLAMMEKLMEELRGRTDERRAAAERSGPPSPPQHTG